MRRSKYFANSARNRSDRIRRTAGYRINRHYANPASSFVFDLFDVIFEIRFNRFGRNRERNISALTKQISARSKKFTSDETLDGPL
jgi:hypothetical protein